MFLINLSKESKEKLL